MDFESGKLGLRASLRKIPTHSDLKELNEKKVSEIVCNSSLGWVGDDLSFLQAIPTVKSFTLLSASSIDLKPLQILSHLEKLSLHAPRAKTVDFSKLELLRDCSIEWISGAETLFLLPKIQRLSIQELPKQHLPSFALMGMLDELKLFGAKIDEFSECGKLGKLKYLRLAGCRKLNSLTGLRHSEHIESLIIQGCPIGNIDDIRFLQKLQNLVIDDCREIETLRPIEGHVALKHLVISGTTKVKDGDLDLIRFLPALKSFSARNFKHYSPSVKYLTKLIRDRSP